ncbi:hypothetical protein GEMRC1_009023 [Eukaryota sp. GEM-RC1]
MVLEFLYDFQQLAKSNRDLARSYLLEHPKLAYAVVSGLYTQSFLSDHPELLQFLSKVTLPSIEDQTVEPPVTTQVAPTRPPHPRAPHHVPPPHHVQPPHVHEQAPPVHHRPAPHPPQPLPHPQQLPQQQRVLPQLAHLPPEQYQQIVQQLLSATEAQIEALPQEQKELYFQLVRMYR